MFKAEKYFIKRYLMRALRENFIQLFYFFEDCSVEEKKLKNLQNKSMPSFLIFPLIASEAALFPSLFSVAGQWHPDKKIRKMQEKKIRIAGVLIVKN